MGWMMSKMEICILLNDYNTVRGSLAHPEYISSFLGCLLQKHVICVASTELKHQHSPELPDLHCLCLCSTLEVVWWFVCWGFFFFFFFLLISAFFLKIGPQQGSGKGKSLSAHTFISSGELALFLVLAAQPNYSWMRGCTTRRARTQSHMQYI